MLTPEQTENIRPKLAVIQMIAAALIVGVIVFAGVIFAIVDWENLNERIKMLSLFGAATGILMFGFSIVAPRVFASSHHVALPAKPDQSEAIKPVLDSLMAEHIIRFALIEAAIILNLMVFMIEPHRAALVVVGIGILLMLIFFPRQSNMITTLEDRLR
jgi:uncharacterized membrane protein